MNNALHRSADVVEGPFVWHPHAVQFYESDAYLAGAVATYLATGFAEGRAGVVIGTEPHRRAIARELQRFGFDPDFLVGEYKLTLVDAPTTLASLMINGAPDAELIRTLAEPMLRRAAAHSNGGRPLVCGEMVDLLWRSGQRAAAIQLENIWNKMAKTFPMDILCWYLLDGFAAAADAAGFAEVCRAHSVVIPTERFTEVSDEERLIEVSMLQQRAKALETELDKSSRLELKLRLALEREHGAREELGRIERSQRDLLALITNLLHSHDAS